ncbi:MAG TPA: DUF4340 domain-containing protein [Burkholderiales bacterium]|nr:DUF4340 domain-containing protein [Burkholderiales bacterium]
MKSRLLLNLALALALAVIALYAYFRPRGATEPQVHLSQLKREAVDRIRIERRDNPTIELEKRGGAWRIISPLHARADGFEVDRLLDIVTAVGRQKLPRENLDRFNLDPAALVVTLNGESFGFGSVNEITNEQYVSAADGVYLVAPYLGYGMPANATKLLSHKLLGEDEAPVMFDFGAWKAVKDDKGSWKTQGTPPHKEPALTPDVLNQWSAEWKIVSSLSSEPFKGGHGKQRVSVGLRDGKTVTFEILAREPDLKLLRVDENIVYQLGKEAGGRLLDPWLVAGQTGNKK